MDKDLQVQIANTQAELDRLQKLLEEQKRRAKIKSIKSGEIVLLHGSPYMAAVVDMVSGIGIHFASLRDGQRWSYATPCIECRVPGLPTRYNLAKMGAALGSVNPNDVICTGKTAKEYYADI